MTNRVITLYMSHDEIYNFYKFWHRQTFDHFKEATADHLPEEKKIEEAYNMQSAVGSVWEAINKQS